MQRPEPRQTLARLLGPAGPEVGCDECFDLIDRYVELQLAGQDADSAIPGLRAHLAGAHERGCLRSRLVGELAGLLEIALRLCGGAERSCSFAGAK